MTQSVEFLFDFGSPTSYLAWTQLPAIAAEANAVLIWKPVLLGAIHKATGNMSPAMVPAKSRWMHDDMQRFARRYGVHLARNPYFPINTLNLMRGAAGTQMQDGPMFLRYVDAVFRGMWQTGENLGDPEVLRRVLTSADINADEIFALVSDTRVKEQLKADTEAAIARGVFGAPTMFVGESMFFGQDRLEFVRQALTGTVSTASEQSD